MPGYAAKKEIKENWAKLPGSPWTLPGSSFTVKNERLGNINIRPPNPRVAEFNVPHFIHLAFFDFFGVLDRDRLRDLLSFFSFFGLDRDRDLERLRSFLGLLLRDFLRSSFFFFFGESRSRESFFRRSRESLRLRPLLRLLELSELSRKWKKPYLL